MPDNSPTITLDVVQAQTNRAKCYNCMSKIDRGSLKGVITVDVDIQDKKTGEIKTVQQNRSLCAQCVRTNIQALSNHLNMIAQKIGL